VATGYVRLPDFRTPGPLDFSGVNQGIDALGQKFEKNRLLDQSKQIGSAIQSGGYGDGADAAFAQGNISLGTQLAGVEQSDEDRDFNRNRLMTQDRRAAGADARSQELHGLNVQSTRDDIQTKLTGRVAGVAQMIRNEPDPQRKAMMTQTFFNANPRMKQLLESYGFDANNPDATYDMIIAEARGMTEPKASEYKTFGSDQGIYRAGSSGMEVIREPVPKIDRPTTVSPGQRIIDPVTGREIYSAPDKPQALQSVSPGQILYDPATGRPVFTAEPKPESPKTVSPGQTLVDPTTGEEIYVASPKPGAPMNATTMREIFEADEGAQASSNVMTALDTALELNDKAYSGIGAETRGYLTSLTGAEGGEATEQLQNVVTQQVLENLKATFGGMPTEGERQILLQVQGSVNKSPEVRKRIYEAAKTAAQRRLEFNSQKASGIRSGEYFQPGYSPQGAPPPPAGGNVDALKQKYGLE
jgi:hypothetical protein